MKIENVVRDTDSPEYKQKDELADSRISSMLERLRGWKWFNIATLSCLWLAYLLCNMSYSIAAAFFPKEVEKKGTSPLVVGILVGSTPLSQVLLSPPIGYLLPRTGVILPVFLGLLLLGVSTICLTFVLLINSMGWFIFLTLLLRLMEGAGAAMFTTATFALLPKLFPRNLPTTVGLVEVASGFGSAIGPPLGGALYKASSIAPFLTLGLCVLALLAPCTILVKKIRIEANERESLAIKTAFQIYTSLTIIIIAIAMVLAYTCFSFYEITIQPFLIDEFNMSDEYIGLVLFSGAFSYLITALVLGPVVNKIGRYRWFIITGVIVNAFAFFAIGLITKSVIGRWYIFLLIMSYLFTGVGAAFSVIPAYSDMLKVTERYIGKTKRQAAVVALLSGIISSSLYLGEFCGSVIGGLLTDYMSFPESAVIFGELLPAEALLLIGVTTIDKYIT